MGIGKGKGAASGSEMETHLAAFSHADIATALQPTHLTDYDHTDIATSLQKTSANTTYYVRTTGDDSNDGLSAGNALATIQAAITKLTDRVEHDIVIDVGAGNFDGFAVSGLTVTEFGSVTINGVLDNPTLSTGTTSGTATGGGAGGAFAYELVDSGQSWTTNELRGMLVLIGGSTYKVIGANDATTIETVGHIGDPTGSSYEILEQTTVINAAATGVGYSTRIWFSGNTFADRVSFSVTNVKITGGTVGFFAIRTCAPALYRIHQSGAYYGFAWQAVGPETIAETMYATGNGGYGILFIRSKASHIKDIFTYNNSGDGAAFWSTDIDMSGTLRSESSGSEGVVVDISGKTNFQTIHALSNSSHGCLFLSCLWIDIDGGLIDSNGGWGVKVDQVGTNVNNQVASDLNMVSEPGHAMVISSNTSGGVELSAKTTGTFHEVSGSGNGTYGVDIKDYCLCVITSSATLTGTSGDCTPDSGTTTLTWASDFASNLDSYTNLDSLSTIKRRD